RVAGIEREVAGHGRVIDTGFGAPVAGGVVNGNGSAAASCARDGNAGVAGALGYVEGGRVELKLAGTNGGGAGFERAEIRGGAVHRPGFAGLRSNKLAKEVVGAHGAGSKRSALVHGLRI